VADLAGPKEDSGPLQHRYMLLEAMAELIPPANDTEPLQLPPKAT
jgi:hypothetical protein